MYFSKKKETEKRNIPSEIWAKRNVLKKLMCQNKFTKSITHEYQKFRKSAQIKINNTQNQKQERLQIFMCPAYQTYQSLKITSLNSTLTSKNKSKQLFNASNRLNSGMKKCYFNDSKYYNPKISISQCNSFIDGNNIKILSKFRNCKQQQGKLFFSKNISQRNESRNTFNLGNSHRRGKSDSQITFSQRTNIQIGNDFLRVQKKQLHKTQQFQIDNEFCFDQTSIKRTKTQLQNILSQNIKTINSCKKQKNVYQRPKSCKQRTKRYRNRLATQNYEQNFNQGWKIRSNQGEQLVFTQYLKC